MTRTLALLHTSSVLVPVFTDLANQFLPDDRVFHMVDESLIKNTIAAGRLEKVTIRRLIKAVESAGLAGADVVMVTCSSMGPGIDIAQQIFDFPVLRVDLPMAEEAVKIGRRIGVFATLATTLAPTSDLIRQAAESQKKDSQIEMCLCEGAFEALIAGDSGKHDQLVTDKLLDLLKRVDVVALAQASTARIVQQIPDEKKCVPILSSPKLGMQRAAQVLRSVT